MNSIDLEATATVVLRGVCARVLSHFSRVQPCATLWTVACQAPPSIGFSRQEYWNGLPFPTPGIFPTQGSNLSLLCLLHWVDSLPLSGDPILRVLHSKHKNVRLSYYNLRGWKNNEKTNVRKRNERLVIMKTNYWLRK